MEMTSITILPATMTIMGTVILAPGTGAAGMAALGEILSGSVNPSGRTVDTYVYDLTDTPTYQNYGNFVFNNVEDLKAELTKADVAYQGAMIPCFHAGFGTYSRSET